MDGLVGILCHATAHAAGIVGEDSTHHARIYRSGVGTDTPSVRLEHVVEKSAHDARLKADLARVLFYAVLAPMFGNIHQNAIRHGLTRETRPCRAEGHRDFVLLGVFEQRLNFTN